MCAWYHNQLVAGKREKGDFNFCDVHIAFHPALNVAKYLGPVFFLLFMWFNCLALKALTFSLFLNFSVCVKTGNVYKYFRGSNVPLQATDLSTPFSRTFLLSYPSFLFCSVCSVHFRSINLVWLPYYSYHYQCTLIVLTCFISLMSCYPFIWFLLFCIAFCAFNCVHCILALLLHYRFFKFPFISCFLSTWFSLILRLTILFNFFWYYR